MNDEMIVWVNQQCSKALADYDAAHARWRKLRDWQEQVEAGLPSQACLKAFSERTKDSSWRCCAERLRPFAISYRTHHLRNPNDKLAEVLAEFDALKAREQ
jgi:hypothetical protein